MDDYQQVNNAEYQQLMAILKQNAGKSFVQRILRPGDFPTLDLGNGSHATHRMAWENLPNGRAVVFPTVMLTEGGQLQDFGKNAWQHASKSGNFIEFDNPAQAEWFASRYKGAWGGRMNNEPR